MDTGSCSQQRGIHCRGGCIEEIPFSILAERYASDRGAVTKDETPKAERDAFEDDAFDDVFDDAYDRSSDDEMVAIKSKGSKAHGLTDFTLCCREHPFTFWCHAATQECITGTLDFAAPMGVSSLF